MNNNLFDVLRKEISECKNSKQLAELSDRIKGSTCHCQIIPDEMEELDYLITEKLDSLVSRKPTKEEDIRISLL